MTARPIPSCSHRRSRPSCCAWAAALLLAGPSAVLAQASPYYVGASLSLSHESNVLRLIDGQRTPNGLSKSDTLASTALLAGINQPFGRQRLSANVTLRDNRYRDNTPYNNQSYQVSAALDWATVERLSGSLSATASRALSPFNLLGTSDSFEKNVESVNSIGATARWGLVSLYALEASASHRRVDNSRQDNGYRERDFRQDTGSLGVSWRPSGATSVGLGLRMTKGLYPRFFRVAGQTNGDSDRFEPDRFERKDIELTASIQPTGASTVSLRLASGDTTYDLSSQRDFSGVTGSLAWQWLATGKTSLNLRLTRDTGQDSYAFQSVFNTPDTVDYSRINTSLAARVDYALSAKVAMNLGLTLVDREVVRLVPGVINDARDTGQERITAFSLGATWRPTRSVSAGCNLSTDDRNGSGRLGSDLKSGSFGCFGQIVLQ